jgi:hypothetical protein
MTQRRVELLHESPTTESFVNSPYRNYPFKGYSTDLNWNLPKP